MKRGIPVGAHLLLLAGLWTSFLRDADAAAPVPAAFVDLETGEFVNPKKPVEVSNAATVR